QWRAGAAGDSPFLAPGDQRALAAIPGVRRAEFQRSQRLILAPARPAIVLLARPVEREGRLPPLVGESHARRPDDPPAVWPSEIAADLYGWRVGQVIELPIPLADKAPKPRHLGPRGLPAFVVAGVWRDYARQQGAVLIERDVYVALTRDGNA